MVGFGLCSWVGVGWRRRWKMRLAIRELKQPGYRLIYPFNGLAVTEAGTEFHHVRRGEPWLGLRGLVSRGSRIRQATREAVTWYPIAVWEWSHHARQINQFEHDIRTQEGTHQVPKIA